MTVQSQTARPGRRTWRELLRQSRPLVLPGAYDALTAKLIARAGFDAMIIGGYSLVAANYGLPDIGLVGLGEMALAMRPILEASSLPVLVDGDTGYGDVKNVTRTVETYESMGAAALILEDQVAPKRCGHMQGKRVIPTDAMEGKLRAAVAARRDREFFIIARTDARAVHGLDEALRRAQRYVAAGADGIFVEAPESIEELATIGRELAVPQVCNMLVGGRTPILDHAQLAGMGFSMIFHATDLIMRATRVMQEELWRIRRGSAHRPEEFAGFEEFQDLLGLASWHALDERFGH
jgi:2,3-dimethylmalate lyase